MKILNNGNVSGTPVLRSEVSRTGEFSPRAFQVYGPRLSLRRVCMRIGRSRAASSPRKRAVAGCGAISRSTCPPCTKTRPSIFGTNSFCTDSETMERRMRPKLSWTWRSSPGERDLCATHQHHQRSGHPERAWEVARERHRQIVADRGMDVEAQLLEVIRDLERQRSRLAIGEITAAFIQRFGKEYGRPITSKWVGHMIRHRLNLKRTRAMGSTSSRLPNRRN